MLALMTVPQMCLKCDLCNTLLKNQLGTVLPSPLSPSLALPCLPSAAPQCRIINIGPQSYGAHSDTRQRPKPQKEGKWARLQLCVSVSLSVHLYVSLAVCLPARLSVCLSVHLSACLPACLSFCPSIRLLHVRNTCQSSGTLLVVGCALNRQH